MIQSVVLNFNKVNDVFPGIVVKYKKEEETTGKDYEIPAVSNMEAVQGILSNIIGEQCTEVVFQITPDQFGQGEEKRAIIHGVPAPRKYPTVRYLADLNAEFFEQYAITQTEIETSIIEAVANE